MRRLALHTAAWVIVLGGALGWACSVTPHFVGPGGSGGTGVAASSSSGSTTAGGGGATSVSSSGGGSSSSASGASTSSSAASSSSSSGDKCMGVTCTALDQCHVAGTCDPGTGTCSNPNQQNGQPCTLADPCMTNPVCENGTCTGTALTCQGGKVCQGGTCVCPAQELFCAGTQACTPQASACSDPTCNLCGVDAACDGSLLNDPAAGYQTTCTSSLGNCDQLGAQADYSAGQIRYHGGASYVCLKLDGNYGWEKLVPSGQCQSAYQHCDYLCSQPLGYSVFCDSAGQWNPNLFQASVNGCPGLYPTLPQGYGCP